MKRVLLIISAGLFAISCSEKCPECPKCPQTSTTTHPTDTIVVDYSKVDQTWLKNNNRYVIGITSTGNFYVGLSLIPENTQHTAASGWLKDNGSKIHLIESSKHIVGVHRLPSNPAFSLPQDAPQLTYGEIKTKVNNLENNPGYFQDALYDKYVVIAIDNNNEVQLNLTIQYDYLGDCYSIPFLRALEREVPDITNETILRFGKYEAKNRRQVVFFKVGDYNRYFNISNKPPFLPETEIETVKK